MNHRQEPNSPHTLIEQTIQYLHSFTHGRYAGRSTYASLSLAKHVKGMAQVGWHINQQCFSHLLYWLANTASQARCIVRLKLTITSTGCYSRCIGHSVAYVYNSESRRGFISCSPFICNPSQQVCEKRVRSNSH